MGISKNSMDSIKRKLEENTYVNIELVKRDSPIKILISLQSSEFQKKIVKFPIPIISNSPSSDTFSI